MQKNLKNTENTKETWEVLIAAIKKWFGEIQNSNKKTWNKNFVNLKLLEKSFTVKFKFYFK